MAATSRAGRPRPGGHRPRRRQGGQSGRAGRGRIPGPAGFVVTTKATGPSSRPTGWPGHPGAGRPARPRSGGARGDRRRDPALFAGTIPGPLRREIVARTTGWATGGRWPCAPPRRPRIWPRPASPGSRTPTSTCAGPRPCWRRCGLLGLPLDGAGDGLPRPAGHRPGHGAPRRRGPGDGRRRRRRGDVHRQSGQRAPRRGGHRHRLGAGRGRGQRGRHHRRPRGGQGERGGALPVGRREGGDDGPRRRRHRRAAGTGGARWRAVLDDPAAAALAGLGAGSRPTSAPPRTSSGRGPATASPSCSRGRSPPCRSPRRRRPRTGRSRSRGLYFRASIVEQLPDPLSPLFADLAGGAVTRVARAPDGGVPGEGALHDGDIGLPTINGYAYYRYSRAGLIRVTLRTPAASGCSPPEGQERPTRWRDDAHPRYGASRALVAGRGTRSARGPAGGGGRAAGGGLRVLHRGAGDHPPGRSSEVLFSAFYDRLVRRPGDRRRSFLLGFRQPADQGREVALGPGRVDAAAPRPRGGAERPPRPPSSTPSTPASAGGGRRPGAVGRVAGALPDAPGHLRPHRLQPGLPQPRAGRGAGPPGGHAALLPRRPGNEPDERQGRASSLRERGGRCPGPARSRAPGGVPPPPALGAGPGAGSRGRPRRRRPRLAADARAAPRARPPAGRRPG